MTILFGVAGPGGTEEILQPAAAMKAKAAVIYAARVLRPAGKNAGFRGKPMRGHFYPIRRFFQSPSRDSTDVSPWRNSRFPASGTGAPTPAKGRSHGRKSVELQSPGARLGTVSGDFREAGGD